MNYGRIDVSSLRLAAKHWTFALPRTLHWPSIRATNPTLREPEGRYFIHCIQHWIIRSSHHLTNRFRKFASHELDQETILVDNHGQVYGIFAQAGLEKDWGVRYFTLAPDLSYTRLAPSQIEAVKCLGLPGDTENEEGLPSLGRVEVVVRQAIEAAIATSQIVRPVLVDPLTDLGIWEQVNTVPMNPPAPEEPECHSKKYLLPHIVQRLQEAYIHIQHSSDSEKKEDGHRLLSSFLKAVMPKQFHRRIDTLNRTMLTRKLSKYYHIMWPKSTDKVLPREFHTC